MDKIKISSLITGSLKAHLIISFIVRLSILGILITSVLEYNFLMIFISTLILLISFLPSIITRRYKIFLPAEFEITLSIFLYASFILGEMRSYYIRYWWWDLMLHSFAAFILGIIGFMIMHTFHVTRKVRTSPLLTAVFSLCFAVSLGVLWEMFEFNIDYFLGFNMQKSGLVDTMTDLIVDSLGALLAALIGFIYIKTGRFIGLKHVSDDFIRMNRRWLRRFR